jgi:predicted PurR-regulated permease PerM
MKNKSYRSVGFLVLLLIFLLLSASMFWYFLQLLALAGILSILFLPMHQLLTRKLRSESVAATVTVLSILILVAVPLYFLTQAAVTEAVSFYTQYKGGELHISRQFLVKHLPLSWQHAAIGLIDNASQKVVVWSKDFATDFEGIISNIATFLFLSFLLFFSTFYLLKDHIKLKRFADDLLRLPTDQEDKLINRIISSVNGVVKGSFIVAIIQGIAGTIGFLLAGLPQPLIWGLVTMVSAFVPTVGTSLVIVPAIIYLLIFKSFTSALILFVWFMVIHMTINNVVSPKMISSQTQLHPLVTLLSILGGIQLFGVLGVIFGPVIIAVFLSLVEEYKNGRA